ncbi:M23 family metallopeptidase [Nostoc sphaeroides]|uniref:Peptidase S1 n=1 Tax=Nostoc sphaeroides CCNUC1 TaxID=2653204 RepID=A0A5P8W1K7_9NOSO|nr:M23 family metallopeptidase [Nostoc sphaeroides]QFS46583.1 peptidase S1 [Nostoc sphaeroides CCNUC1]
MAIFYIMKANTTTTDSVSLLQKILRWKNFVLLTPFLVSLVSLESATATSIDIELISPFKTVNGKIGTGGGYNTSGHGGSGNSADLMALDFFPNQGGAGVEVVATAPGEVWHTSSCWIVLRHPGSVFTSYLHVRPSSDIVSGKTVVAGQLIGTLAAMPSTDRNCGEGTVPHVHLMLNKWSGSGEAPRAFPYQDKWNPLPFLNICGKTFKYKSSAVNQHASTSLNVCKPRIGVLVGQNLLVKEGALNTVWTTMMLNVSSFQLEGSRIATLLTDKKLWVKEGDLSAQWVGPQADNVISFKLWGNRIAVLTADKKLWVKQGDLSAPWVGPQADNVSSFQLNGDRIGVLKTDGKLWVKQGDLFAPWVGPQADNVSSFQLNGDRIGVLKTDGKLWVKQGDLFAQWVGPQADNVSSFQLNGDRIGVLKTDKKLWVKQGDLFAQWVGPQADNVSSFQLNGGRIGVLKTDKKLWVKQGDLFAQWVGPQADNVASFELNRSRIGILSIDSAVRVKDGSLYESWQNQASSVNRFLLEW